MYGLSAMPKDRDLPSRFEEKTGFSDKILVPGYLGDADKAELQAIYEELHHWNWRRKDKLRKLWGFTEGEKITFKKIKVRCGQDNGTED